jgi:hypothetical protein
MKLALYIVGGGALFLFLSLLISQITALLSAPSNLAVGMGFFLMLIVLGTIVGVGQHIWEHRKQASNAEVPDAPPTVHRGSERL